MNLKELQDLETKLGDLVKHICNNKYICGRKVETGVVVFCVGCKQWILLPSCSSIGNVENYLNLKTQNPHCLYIHSKEKYEIP